MSNAELHTLTGAYALHALPDSERDEFERHLADCRACAVEVRELSGTAVRLGLAVAGIPPRDLRERVLREIAAVRQEPPSDTRRSRTGGSTNRTGRWPGFALAACLAAAGCGGIAVRQHQEARAARQDARTAQRQNEQLTQVLAAPDARTGTRTPGGGARGTMVFSEKENRAVLLASGMREPPGGKVYQLWFDGAGTMRSAGLMKAANTSTTQYATLLDGPVDRASGTGITMEPAGGSTRPTSAPAALLTFPTARPTLR
ncbi:anti-sigma factor domain-containing protein [Streptomyces sp. NPDC093149]|uniref:anti-sigma factor n=1 Tax=Streptomyces sp. NPDC093149 TaxID=3366031 RepID=UPI003814BA9E